MLNPMIPTADLASFLQNDFEKEVTLINGSPFQSYGFDLQSFFRILVNQRWNARKLRFASRDDDRTSEELFDAMIAPSGRFTLDRIKAARAAKMTTVVNGIGHLHGGLREMLAGMNCEAYYQTGANAYYTPANSSGFAPHWDMHDVFFLQVHGTKQWLVSENADAALPLPSKEYGSPKGTQFSSPTKTVTLEEGQVLYIPRGHLHAGESATQDSLHVTVRLTPITPADILTRLAKELPSIYNDLRVSVRSLGPDQVSQADAMRELFVELLSGADLGETLAQARREIEAVDRENLGETFGNDIADLLGEEQQKSELLD